MDDVYKQALAMQNKLHNYLDQPNDSTAQALKKEVQRLTDEIEMKKNKISLEDRVKSIIRILESFKGDQVIDYNDVDDLKDRSEDIRRAIRNL